MEQIRRMRENFDVALRQKYYNEETTAKTRDRENIAMETRENFLTQLFRSAR